MHTFSEEMWCNSKVITKIDTHKIPVHYSSEQLPILNFILIMTHLVLNIASPLFETQKSISPEQTRNHRVDEENLTQFKDEIF